MELTLNMQPIVVRDETGAAILEAPLFDVFHRCGSVLAAEGVMAEENPVKFGKVADALNATYGTRFTWGSAMQLVTALEAEVISLKKNGEGVPPLAMSEESPSPSVNSPDSPSSTN